VTLGQTIVKKRERRLRTNTIRRLILVICATAVGVIPAVKATEGEASSRHIGKHHKLKKPGLNSRASREIRPVARAGFERGDPDVCPGNPHGAYECKIWPPPVDVDPDRRNGGDGP
jgi:hypothetical protein